MTHRQDVAAQEAEPPLAHYVLAKNSLAKSVVGLPDGLVQIAVL
jgi:hypothetical protein